MSAFAAWLVAALTVGYLGRKRLIGLVGFTLLALLAHPLVALLVLILTAPRGPRKDQKVWRPLRPGEKRPFFPSRVGSVNGEPQPRAAAT